MSDLQRLRIGYVPCSPSFQAPGDRRRFCYYASKRNLRFELARPAGTYDVVILTQAADISMWVRHPRNRSRIVFDFMDSYLSIPGCDMKGLFRGLAKFAVGQNRRLLLNYRVGLERMCRRADAVICSTLDQRQNIVPYLPNVYPILDFHGSVTGAPKLDYAERWRLPFCLGRRLPRSLSHLLEIKGALQEFRKPGTSRYMLLPIWNTAAI